ncbi:TetR/AcrR family transcriptional regulator [uncultured Clostridium sp.]|uniref:TetR/AcrR family transcriptional regulator n=1 Tax=uncultured Clostridium sp. TaxID=59620 RepID=UPI0028EDA7B6|nr:TetR/AcrR family transcriptional regulator [uncultured Clostridium sp.]
MNEKFFNLPIDKQNIIINAGYKVFASYPYKKAPMSMISYEANISKGLLFHYFENKKGLYLFLFNKAVAYSTEEAKKTGVNEETDFFEFISKTIILRAKMVQRYPYMYHFVTRAYYEQIDIIKDAISTIKGSLHQLKKEETLSRIDVSKFRNPSDLDQLFDIAIYLSEGYVYRNQDNIANSLDDMVQGANKMFEILKRNFYI